MTFLFDRVFFTQKKSLMGSGIEILKQILNMVARPRIELGTHGFSIRCSTYWAITPMSRIKQFKCFAVKQVLGFLKQVLIFKANWRLFAYFLFKTQIII